MPEAVPEKAPKAIRTLDEGPLPVAIAGVERAGIA